MRMTWLALMIAGTGMGFNTAAQAESTLAVGARVGTLGIGLEGTYGINEVLNLRVPFNTYEYDDTSEEDGIDYEATLDLQSLGVVLDYHPFRGSFFLSGGLYSHGNELTLFATDRDGSERFELGADGEERVYFSDPNDPLTLDGLMDLGSAAPYLGFGWGNPIQGDWNLYLRFEVGAFFQGQPSVALDASGSAREEGSNSSFSVDGDSAEAQIFRAQLDSERQNLEAELDDFEIYPVVTFAIGYRFTL